MRTNCCWRRRSRRAGARTRHLDFYLALVGAGGREIVRSGAGIPGSRAWTRERETCSRRTHGAELADARAQLGAAPRSSTVQLYWMRRGMLRLGHQVTVEAPERPAARARNFARCRALYAAGNLGRGDGALDEAQVYVGESGDRARTRRPAAHRCGAGAVGRDLQRKRRAGRGLAVATRSHSRWPKHLGDSLRVTNALGSLGRLHNIEGDADAAEALFERSLALSRQHGYRNNDRPRCSATSRWYRSAASGSTAQAALLSDALAIVEEIGSKSSGLEILRVSAALAAMRREWERAAAHSERRKPRASGKGSPPVLMTRSSRRWSR